MEERKLNPNEIIPTLTFTKKEELDALETRAEGFINIINARIAQTDFTLRFFGGKDVTIAGKTKRVPNSVAEAINIIKQIENHELPVLMGTRRLLLHLKNQAIKDHDLRTAETQKFLNQFNAPVYNSFLTEIEMYSQKQFLHLSNSSIPLEDLQNAASDYILWLNDCDLLDETSLTEQIARHFSAGELIKNAYKQSILEHLKEFYQTQPGEDKELREMMSISMYPLHNIFERMEAATFVEEFAIHKKALDIIIGRINIKLKELRDNTSNPELQIRYEKTIELGLNLKKILENYEEIESALGKKLGDSYSELMSELKKDFIKNSIDVFLGSPSLHIPHAVVSQASNTTTVALTAEEALSFTSNPEDYRKEEKIDLMQRAFRAAQESAKNKGLQISLGIAALVITAIIPPASVAIPIVAHALPVAPRILELGGKAWNQCKKTKEVNNRLDATVKEFQELEEYLRPSSSARSVIVKRPDSPLYIESESKGTIRPNSEDQKHSPPSGLKRS